jgi:hypothetical protein
MTDVKEVIEVSSNELKQCPHYPAAFKFSAPETPLDERINHFIKQHGYKLLHVGQQTTSDADSNPWQTTVAVLGK